MPFGINEFSSEIAKSGVAHVSDFMVEINAPGKAFSGDARAMQLRIEQVSIPARTLLTFVQNYYGPPRDIPYRYVSAPISLTILLSEDMREREFFMQWQDLFVGTRRTSTGASPEGIYDCGYFEECVGSVTIKQYGRSPGSQGRGGGNRSLFGDIKDAAEAFGVNTSAILNPGGINIGRLFGIGKGNNQEPKPLYEITLEEAFPITINEVQMNWADDGLAKLQVEMRYTYLVEKHPKSDVSSAIKKSRLRKGIEAFQKFAPTFALVKAQGVGGAIRASAQAQGQALLNAGKAVKSILPF